MNLTEQKCTYLFDGVFLDIFFSRICSTQTTLHFIEETGSDAKKLIMDQKTFSV